MIRTVRMKGTSILCTRGFLGTSTQQHIKKVLRCVLLGLFGLFCVPFHVQYMYIAIHYVRVWLPSVIPTSAQGAEFRFWESARSLLDQCLPLLR